MHSNPETNSPLCRVHSKHFPEQFRFPSTQAGVGVGRCAQGITAIAVRRSLLILNACAGKGPDLKLSAVHAVRIDNLQESFEKEGYTVELDLLDSYWKYNHFYLVSLVCPSVCSLPVN